MPMTKRIALCLLAASFTALGACGSSTTPPGGNPDPTTSPTPSPTETATPQIVFTPVGESLDGALIDLEFLPGQNGESLAIAKDGKVYYLSANFAAVGAAVQVANVMDEGERGLLNVVADPDYATNGFVYFYYTVNDGDDSNADVNRVERYTVAVNVPNGTFTLGSSETIIEFDKAQAPAPSHNHNGGALLFDAFDNLLIAVGDGGGTSSADQNAQVSQKWDNPLGKIHRLIPVSDGVNPYTIPDSQNVKDAQADQYGELTTIYSRGLRNPFTMVLDEDSDLFLGDVGANKFEEVNCVYFMHENYGWPLCEGDCETPVFGFQDPIHGFAHDDETFNDQDPEENQTGGPQSIVVSAYYLGSAYEGRFEGKVIYNEYFDGWVRLLTLDQMDRVIGDEHIGHQESLTGLHENPADGLLYGTSGDSDKILRLDLLN